MAVISKAAPPPKPSDLDLKLRSDKSLEIRYFQFGGPMIHADHSTGMEVKGFAARVASGKPLQRLPLGREDWSEDQVPRVVE